ncbi:LuxR family transcriptional regulator [Agrobacterium larrymoorei]|uniref:LuxR family transcriptional regulator n=1 Tax=Agrobacterium larrymoorei TaxID=160699 RepID=UPI001572D4F0|nr:LuxR family transcriptional regulator [Agrobacterium larrymoorei]NTJ43372.1 LuxR family transcriptional regulator [Agrobacterium larrymoorei]
MHNVLQFLSVCDEGASRERFLAAFSELIRHYGFEYYRMSRRSDADVILNGAVLVEKLPSGWHEIYAAKKYDAVDPVKRTLGLLQRPFRWRDVIGLLPQASHRKRAAKLFQDAARMGMREGYAFPIHGRNGLIGGVFVSGQGCYFTPPELQLFEAAMRAAFWKMLDLSGQLKDVLTVPDLSVAQITKRELEVLTLLAQGLTSPEIGKSLSISNHTVDWYINGIQRKLNARNRQHVVALAFRYGVIA